MSNDPVPTQGMNKYTALILGALLVSAVVTVGFLVWSGKDIGPYIGFLVGFIPPTVAALVAVRQNEQLLRNSTEIKANVNGNLTRLVDAVAKSVPVASLESSIAEAIKAEFAKRDTQSGQDKTSNG